MLATAAGGSLKCVVTITIFTRRAVLHPRLAKLSLSQNHCPETVRDGGTRNVRFSFWTPSFRVHQTTVARAPRPFP